MGSDYIDIHTASTRKYLNISVRQIARMCCDGLFKTAFKGGTQGKTSKWQIARAEILSHKCNGHAMPWR